MSDLNEAAEKLRKFHGEAHRRVMRAKVHLAAAYTELQMMEAWLKGPTGPAQTMRDFIDAEGLGQPEVDPHESCEVPA